MAWAFCQCFSQVTLAKCQSHPTERKSFIMINDKTVFWMWVVCGALGFSFLLLCIFIPSSLLFESVYRNWFENILPLLSSVLIAFSWVYSLHLTSKAIKIKPFNANPWWMIGSVGWCFTMSCLLIVMILMFAMTSTLKLHPF